MIKPAAHVFYIGDEDLPPTANALAALYQVPVSEVEKYAAIYAKDGAMYVRIGSASPNTLGGGPTNPVGNILWVDRVNGNDASAIRGRFDKAYLTNSAAKDAALAGDTVIVYPGLHDETGLLKQAVAWQFIANATINYTGAATQGIFDDLALPVVATIAGHGRFANEAVVGTPSVLRIDNFSSDIGFEADYASANGAAFDLKAGNSRIDVRQIFGAGVAGRCISVSDGIHNARAQSLIGGGPALSVIGGSIDLECDTMSTTGSGAACLLATGGIPNVRARRINGANGAVSLSSCVATIENSLIQSNSSNPVVDIGPSAAVTLRNCTILANGEGPALRIEYTASVRLYNCYIVGSIDYPTFPPTVYGWNTVRKGPLPSSMVLLGTNNTEDVNLT